MQMRAHQKKRNEHLHEVALRAKLSLRCFLASQPESAGSSGVVMKRASVLFCAYSTRHGKTRRTSEGEEAQKGAG